MPKRYRRDDDDDDGRGGSRVQRRRRHLCIVLDDWSEGYSLYKLDVADLDGDPDDCDLDLRADPPLFRLEIPPDERDRFARFAAVGSRVVAINYMEEDKEAPCWFTTWPRARPPRSTCSTGPRPAAARARCTRSTGGRTTGARPTRASRP
ncbi:hypothetical protein PR202_gb18963 [Eleusine coracana subsp. coracana]|uniref:Uncharacterized protein n=1 Tax=Eleusine coracana subsp. coracana TaxID=191504 RepID=A0AAV5F4S6_ELECO|nr:hypothetical protein PR202_gb18963 [Eleusine coracana subsp. coracana]